MDFRKLINKIDGVQTEAKKEVKRKQYKTASEVIADLQDAVFAEPSKSQIKYSSANIQKFTDAKAEIAYKLSELSQLIKNNDDLSLFLSNVSNMIHNDKQIGPGLVKVVQAAMERHKDIPLEKDPDSEVPYDDSDDDEFESQSHSNIAKAIEEQNLEEEFKILWDEEPKKRGGGMYQAIEYANGTKGYVPMAVDGRPIWTGSVRDRYMADRLKDMGFGLPAYSYGKDFDADFQGNPANYDQGSGEYVGTHRKVGSRWVALDQYKHWSKSDDGNFYTDRSEALKDVSFAEWKQAGDIRNINHELKMLALQIQAIPMRDQKEAYEAILTVNRAYRGDAQAFEDMTRMVNSGVDIQVMIAAAGFRGKRALQDLANNDEIEKALQSKAHAAKLADLEKEEAEEKAVNIMGGKAGTFGKDGMTGQTRYKGDIGLAKDAEQSQSSSSTQSSKPKVNQMPDVQLQGMYESENLTEFDFLKKLFGKKPEQKPANGKLPFGGERRIQSNGGTVNFNIDKNKNKTQWSYQGKEYTIYATDEELDKFENSHHSNGWEMISGTREKVVSKDPKPVEIKPYTPSGDDSAMFKPTDASAPKSGVYAKDAQGGETRKGDPDMVAQAEKRFKSKKLDPNSDEAKKLFKDLELESIQNEGDNIYHPCTKSFKHDKFGEGEVIHGEHTLSEDGTVTHYDAKFVREDGSQFIVRNIPVANMKECVVVEHSHPAKKKKKVKESIEQVEEDIWFNDLTDVTLHGDEFYEAFGWIGENDENIEEAEYQGRTVKLNKPMRGDVKKFKVYVKNPKGNVVKVNFGDPDMKIKKSNPARRKSFRARHNCDTPGPKHKARYWSCRKW